MKEIRKLVASEIEIRVSTVTKDFKWAQLLVYKTARIDMELLDEVFGPANWQSLYQEIKGVMYCGIGVRASAIQEALPFSEWVWKWNAGVESKGTGEDDSNNSKGEASDSFKRSGFLWGIGRELYKWTGIWVELTESDFRNDNKLKTRFEVIEVKYDEKGEPKYMEIIDNHKKTRYTFGSKPNKPQDTKQDRSETLPQSTNQHTTIQEKAPTSENNGVKPKDTQYAKETTTILSEEEAKNEVKKTNRQIWDCLIDVVENYCAKEKINDEEKNEGIKTGITKFFTDKLKISIKQLELSETNRKPLVQGNVVVVYDMNLLKDFQDFLGKEIFLPF